MDDVESDQGPENHAEQPVEVPAEILLSIDPLRFYEPSYGAVLEGLVAAILAAEGPMTNEHLAQRTARFHGFHRTGRRIREAVYATLPRSVAKTKEGDTLFVWPPGVQPAAWERFREPPAGTYRDPQEIPMQELCALARRIVSSGQSGEAAVIAMRDALGMAKMREAARQRCLAAIDAVHRKMI